MNFNFNGRNTSTNKASFRKLIAGKQQFLKRVARRFKQSNNSTERTFLKAEARRVVGELKQFAAQWKKNGFGSNAWVTRGFNRFSTTNNSTRRTTRSQSRSNARRTSRASSSYRSYVAW